MRGRRRPTRWRWSASAGSRSSRPSSRSPSAAPTVNLIDTPGHPDFVAEVERALSVLDGVVLVVSAVEGVQPQTRILWRALQRLRVPTLFFVNKIDRRGAGYERLLGDIAERLTPAIIPMGSVTRTGHARGRRSSPTTGRPGRRVPAGRTAGRARRRESSTRLPRRPGGDAAAAGCAAKLAAQVRDTLVHPVFFGSAITGAGVDVAAARARRPAARSAAGDAAGPVSRPCLQGRPRRRRRQDRLCPHVLRHDRGPGPRAVRPRRDGTAR